MKLGVTENEFHFMVECMTADLIERLVRHENYDFGKAVETVYSSGTFAALQKPETCLYYQSPGYVMHFLIDEIKNGRIIGVHC